MGKFTNDPARYLQQHAISEMFHDFQVGGQGNIDEVRLQRYYFEESSQKVIDAAITDQELKLIKYLVHSSEEYLSII